MEEAGFFADKKSIALKRRLARGDGHSCSHCSIFVVPSEQTTTIAKIHELAAQTSCPWWPMFSDKIKVAEFETKLFNIIGDNAVAGIFDHGPYLPWADVDFEALAPTMDDVERREYLRLRDCRQRDVSWTSRVEPGLRPYESDQSVTISMERPDFWPRLPPKVDVRLTLPPSSKIRQGVTYSRSFFAMVLPGGFVHSSVPRVPINTDPGSQESFELVRHWLDTCATKNGCGILDIPPSVPAMLLALAEHHVRIVDMSERFKVRYVALSYCWGTKAPSITLHRGTIGQLRAGIPLEHLDATIRDAVIVVRAVGLEYLWVDALCIFQDNTEGKAHEIAHMHEIYRNATFTLIASRAAAVQEGFLDKRRHADREEPRGGLQVKYLADAGGALDRDLRLYPNKRDKLEPWYQRAWTLQEVLLSGRLLQYSTTQTTWNCQYCHAQYRDYDGWLPSRFNSSSICGDNKLLDRASRIIRQPSATASINDSRRDIFRTWDDIVRAFSNRKLSYHRDRLPAISAIAREFSRVLKDEYLCGHWKSRLASDLLWYGRDCDLSGSSSRTTDNPSWSWASHHASVQRIYGDITVDDDFQILRYEVVPETPEDPYGAIKSASLTIRGVVAPIPPPSIVSKDRTLDTVGESLEKEQYCRFMRGIKTFVDPDALYDSPNPHLLIIGLDNTPEGTPGAPTGLILSKQGPDTYTRIGFFEPAKGWGNMDENRALLRYLYGGKKNIKVITVI